MLSATFRHFVQPAARRTTRQQLPLLSPWGAFTISNFSTGKGDFGSALERESSSSDVDGATFCQEVLESEAQKLRAFYVSHGIGITALARSLRMDENPKQQIVQKSHIILTLAPQTAQKHPQYAVFYEYGAAVFFNCCEVEEKDLIDSTLERISPFMRRKLSMPLREDWGVVVEPSLNEWGKLGTNCLLLQKLDVHNIRVLSGVLAQSVALLHYEARADDVLDTFCSLNESVLRRRGNLSAKIAERMKATLSGDGNSSLLPSKSIETELSKETLFHLIATNNEIITNVLSKLKVLDRASNFLWNSTEYYDLWELLRVEFEIEDRFQSVEDKLNIVQENARFFVEVVSDRYGHRLEKVIIFLIAVEIGFEVVDHWPSSSSLSALSAIFM